MFFILGVVFCVVWLWDDKERNMLFFHDAIDGNTAVGTHCCASGTAYALVRILVGYEVVSPVVNFLGLELEDIAGAGDHT